MVFVVGLFAGYVAYLALPPLIVDYVNENHTDWSYHDVCEGFVTVLQKYLLCNTVDDDEVIGLVRSGRQHHDGLAIECVEYNHDPQRRHVANGPEEVVIVANDRTIALPCNDSPLLAEVTHIELLARLNSLPAPIVGVVPRDEHVVVPAVVADEPELATTGEDIPQLVPAIVADAPVVEQVRQLVCVLPPDCEAAVPDEERADDRPSKVFVNCHNVREEVNHNRISHHRRGEYIASVVDEIKNKLGLPKDNAANRLCVRRMAMQAMNGHYVRPTHQRLVIETIVSMVFVPDDMDILGAKISASNTVRNHHYQHQNAGPRNVWQRIGSVFSFRGNRGFEEKG